MTATQKLKIAEKSDRQKWMSILARSKFQVLQKLWQTNGIANEFSLLRPAEIGMVMLQGKVNGDGAPFNIGEATVTRCSVRLNNGAIGTSYILGRHKPHAELAAVIDAEMQNESVQQQIWEDILSPLERLETQRQAKKQEKTQQSKVDFFTLVRGEDD